jgi:hypothetical protein
MVFSIAGLLLGAWLGLRFKALALVPVALAGMALLTLLSFVPGSNVSGIAFVASLVALNAGYLAATIIRFAVSPALRQRPLTSSPVLSEPAL